MEPPSDEPREIECKGNNSTITITVGETVWHGFHRHGSVGEDAEFEIGDTEVLKHVDTVTEYLHPEHMKKPGWTGGDAERGKWFFKAITPGTTKFTVRIMFRFDVESECTMNIVVK